MSESNIYEAIFETTNVGMAVAEISGKFIKVNKSLCDFLGYAKEELQNKTFQEISYETDLKEDLRHIDEINKGIIDTFCMEKRYFTKDGSLVWVDLTVTAVRKADKKVDYYIAVIKDINELKVAQEELHLQKEFITNLLDAQPNMMILTDGNTSSFMNKAVLRYFKCKSLIEFTERYNCICYQFICNDIYFHSKKVKDGQNWIEALLEFPQNEHIVTIQSLKDGIIRAFNVSVRKFNNDYAVNFTDISETVFKQRDLENKTIHDKLTKAYNREYLEQNIQRVLSQNETIAFTIIDIDHFKNINDTYGHDVGDEVLKELVKVISDSSRKEDVLIRWGGEEFLLLLKADDNQTLFKTVEHIRKAVENHKFSITDKITCSFGAVLHDKSHTWKKSFKAADIALYEAKASGRNRVVIH